MVVNAPTSNIVTAAELAFGLLLATARNIPQANAALKNGEWKRSKYTGVELSEKTLGVVGLGRIGVLVAQRMSAFGMKIVAYDPYVQPARAAQMGVQLLSLDELLEVSDFITVHLPKTPETLGLIGDEALHKVKPTVRIVNAARGGIVDEAALYSGLKEGRVAGAGLDVYAKEPCTDSPLFELDQVVCTPHLGASTDEAQEKAGIAVAQSVRLALAGELVPDAVNVQGGVIAEDVKPGLPLAEQLGRIFTALAGEVAVRLDVEVYGEITQHDVKVLELSALKGVFEDVVDETVSYVNAPLLRAGARRGGPPDHVERVPEPPQRGDRARHARERRGGLGLRHPGRPQAPRRRSSRSASSTWTWRSPTTWSCFATRTVRASSAPSAGCSARPGSTSPACRSPARTEGGDALVVLTVDDTIPQNVLTEIAEEIGATSARSVNLTD